MGDNNLLAAYKLINSQLVLSNQKLKEDMKFKVDVINSLNEDLFQYRIENKTLRDMVQKLLEQFNMVTKIMGSVRDQSESVFNKVFNEHAKKEHEQETRRPLAGSIYKKRRTERPPYVDEAAIEEAEDENYSMEDYRTAIEDEEENAITSDHLPDDETMEDETVKCSTPSKSPLVKRLERKSRNRSIDESFETIDANRVVKALRKSQEYLQHRESRDGRLSDDESMQEKSASKMETEGSNLTVGAHAITVDATDATKGQSTLRNSTVFEASSICTNSGVESDLSTQSEHNLTTDQSLQPGSMKRMASDSLLTTLIDRENNKENSTINNDTICNAAACSTPVVRRGRPKKQKQQALPVLSPVPLKPFVSLKPLTKQNLSKHDIFYEGLELPTVDLKKEKFEEHDSCSDHNSLDSNDSQRRPRRKAAPKTLKEPYINSKLRRT